MFGRVSALLAIGCLLGWACPSLGVQYRPFRVLRGEEANLTCWEAASGADVQQWIAPDDRIINGNDPSFDSAKYEINWDGMGGLRIREAVKADGGVYRCLQQRSSGYSMTKTTLEVIDVTYIPEIDDWQANLARGLISAACMATFFIATCAINHYRWKPEEIHDADCRGSVSSSRRSSARRHANGIDNPAAQFDDTKEIDTGL